MDDLGDMSEFSAGRRTVKGSEKSQTIFMPFQKTFNGKSAEAIVFKKMGGNMADVTCHRRQNCREMNHCTLHWFSA